MSRKPRSDSKLLTLPEERQLEAFDAIKRQGYTKARLWIAEHLGVDVSIGAMASAYKRWIRRESENRILQAVTASDAILESAAGKLPKLDQAMEAALKQAAFEAALSGDNETIKTLVGLVLKFKSADQDDRKIALQERRLKQAEEAEAVVKTAELTPEEREARLKQIFGMA